MSFLLYSSTWTNARMRTFPDFYFPFLIPIKKAEIGIRIRKTTIRSNLIPNLNWRQEIVLRANPPTTLRFYSNPELTVLCALVNIRPENTHQACHHAWLIFPSLLPDGSYFYSSLTRDIIRILPYFNPSLKSLIVVRYQVQIFLLISVAAFFLFPS